MAKAKFRFDPVTLSYERINLSLKQKLRNVSKDFLMISGVALLILYGLSFFVESPHISKLRSQQENYIFKYEVLNKTIEEHKQNLENISYNDDNVYRVYFESDPVPADIRNSGFGGVNRYESLEYSRHADLMISTLKNVDQFSKQLLVQSKSFDEVENLAINKEKLLEARPAIQPVSIHELTRFGSSFGMRDHPLLKIRRMHEGIDLTAPRGTKIYASATGKILVAGSTVGGYGKKIIIDHGFGYRTLYAHCYQIFVKSGQKVKRGDIIGEVGNTGLSKGAHLHYEVHHNGRAVNPINYYANDLSADEYDMMIQFLENSDPSFDIN